MRDHLQKGTIHLVLLAIAGLGTLTALKSFGEDPVPGGVRFDAIGDSVTWGHPISFAINTKGQVKASDNEYQGWPELLATLLPTDNGGHGSITNLGIPGIAIKKLATTHPREYFKYSAESPDALLLIGTNDSNPAVETPSGLGCSGSSCDGTYKDTLHRLIDNLLSNGPDSVFVGLLPPTWGNNSDDIFPDPLGTDATRNQLVQEYNQVIVEEVAKRPGVFMGPDLFSCFLTPTVNHFSLFEDALHPNTLGQVYMAALWRDAIARAQSRPSAEPCLPPIYILKSLDSYKYGHKQNLLAVGDSYYTDEEFTLVNVPAELTNGIWVMQPNAKRNNEDEVYLRFDAGSAAVTVFIAYDAAGSPPSSTTHEFAPAHLTSELKVSDPSVERLDVVMAENIVGVVTIGGNKSAHSPGRQQGYLVIVVP
jgi:lysophospholipase L1-like esterase